MDTNNVYLTSISKLLTMEHIEVSDLIKEFKYYIVCLWANSFDNINNEIIDFLANAYNSGYLNDFILQESLFNLVNKSKDVESSCQELLRIDSNMKPLVDSIQYSIHQVDSNIAVTELKEFQCYLNFLTYLIDKGIILENDLYNSLLIYLMEETYDSDFYDFTNSNDRDINKLLSTVIKFKLISRIELQRITTSLALKSSVKTSSIIHSISSYQSNDSSNMSYDFITKLVTLLEQNSNDGFSSNDESTTLRKLANSASLSTEHNIEI